MEPLEERVTDLEIRITYQDDLVKTLNDVIVELRSEIEVLQRKVLTLEEHARSAQDGDKPKNERPPHY